MPETARTPRNHLDELDIAVLDDGQLGELRKAEEAINRKPGGDHRVYLVALTKPAGRPSEG